MIRSKAVNPKPAMQALKQRVGSKNGRVQMYALSLADTCIKNGGDHFLAEIASKEFTDELSGVIKSAATNAEVRTMALNMLQQWALAFKNKPALSYLPEVYSELKASGIKFPPPPANAPTDTLLETATAPAWVDADACMRCRTAFTFTNRKHHCRNCGLVFCGECSSRSMPLPRFGIKEPVRVCESCFVKAGKAQPAPAVPGRTPRSRRDFDEDLQRAIELSLAQSQPGASAHQPSEPPLVPRGDMSEDEQMRLAIEASLRDMEQAPSAPAGEGAEAAPEWKPLPTFDLQPRETDTLLTFTNTMEQMTAYGERDLSRFPHAHVLHDQAMSVAPKLARNYEEKSTKKQMLAEMQAKLSEAVTLYGSILDGQQAYAQQQQQQQQRQYVQHAQQYAPPQGQSQYAPPQPYTNGYAYAPQYAAQQPYAPQYASSSSHMYPAMPAQPVQPAYQPPQQWQAPPHQQQWAPPSRQASYAAPLEPQPTHASQASHTSAQPQSPQPYAQYQPLQVSAEPQTYGAGAGPDPALPSAPPQPSAPEMSPTSPAAQPAAPLASPSALPSAPPASAPSSPVKSLASPQPLYQQAFSPPQQQQHHQSPQHQPHSQHQQQPPQHQQQHQQAAPQQQQWQQPQQQASQQGYESQWQHPGYTPAMFPSAPSTLPEPAPAAKQEPPQEALLIEL